MKWKHGGGEVHTGGWEGHLDSVTHTELWGTWEKKRKKKIIFV